MVAPLDLSETAIANRALDLIGDVCVTLITSSSSPHHDLFVCLCDVDPRGRTINITDAYVRLRPSPSPAASFRTTVLMGSPVAWQVPRGHRLRLLVSGGAFPRFARNLGMDENDGSGVAMMPVEITLHCAEHDACVLSFSASPKSATADTP